MKKLNKFILPSILVAFCIAVLTAPANAQAQVTSLSLDGPSTVIVCNNFRVDLVIGHPANPLGSFDVDIEFDPTQMELVDAIIIPSGWELFVEPDTNMFRLVGTGLTESDIVSTGTHTMVTLFFHCIDIGTSDITTLSATLTEGIYAAGTQYAPSLNVDLTVTQDPARAVGGVMVSANKLFIFAPYIIIAGIVVAVGAAVVIRKQRKA